MPSIIGFCIRHQAEPEDRVVPGGGGLCVMLKI